MDRRIPRSTRPAVARPAARHAPAAPVPRGQAAVLALQRQAGNAAVAAMLAKPRPAVEKAPPAPPEAPPPRSDRERARAVVQRWMARNVQRNPGDAALPDAPVIAKTSVGKPGIVDQDLKPVDGYPDGLRLRSQPTTEGDTAIGVLRHNAQVFVDAEAPGDWYYVVSTADGRDGWVYKKHVVTHDKMPDPGAKLHRVKPGETAFDIVAKYYGQSSFVAGSDARFYSNVLVYANEEHKRGGIRAPTESEKLELFKTMGPGKYLDAWTVAGLSLWVPSKEWADALKGKVSSGSFSRDAWEKAKSMLAGGVEFLLAGPAFVGGLIVGVGESIVDTVVGVVELVKKIVTGEIVSDVKALIDVLSDEKKRNELAEHLKGEFLAKWNHGNPIKKWYWRGWIFGYVIGEILVSVLTAGAGAAVKGTKLGMQAAKLGAEFSAKVRKLPGVSRAIAKADELAKAGAAMKLTAGVGLKMWTDPIMKGLGELWGGLKKRIDDALLAKRMAAVSFSITAMAAKYNFPVDKLSRIVAVAQKYNLRIWLRKGSAAGLAQLEKGAVPKPKLLMAKSITPEDLHLNPRLTPDDVGLTGYFDPVKPPKNPPKGVSTKEWKKVHQRFAERQAEFKDQAEIMRILNHDPLSEVRQKNPDWLDTDVIVDVDDKGVVKIIEVETMTSRNVAGDIDFFHITAADGSPAARGGHIDEILIENGLAEHPAHILWNPKTDADVGIDVSILRSHKNGGLLEISPTGLRDATGMQVPGYARRLISAEFQWKIVQMRRAAVAFVKGLMHRP